MAPPLPPWTASVDTHLRGLVEQVIRERGPARLRAWQMLLQQVAPHVERWAGSHRVLRAVRLTSEDESRAVLVRVVERLQRGQHENLKAFLARGSIEARSLRSPSSPAHASGPVRTPETGEEGPADADAVERFAALSSLEEEDLDLAAQAPPAEGTPDDLTATPLRAWLKGLTDFAVRDHAVARLGRRTSWRTLSDTAVEDRRKMNSDAEPFSESHAGSHRPAITDLLTLRQIVGELSRFIEQSLPAEQQVALRMRLEDASYPEIARALGLARPAEAEQLVRAAKERLRVAFRAERERFGLAV